MSALLSFCLLDFLGVTPPLQHCPQLLAYFLWNDDLLSLMGSGAGEDLSSVYAGRSHRRDSSGWLWPSGDTPLICRFVLCHWWWPSVISLWPSLPSPMMGLVLRLGRVTQDWGVAQQPGFPSHWGSLCPHIQLFIPSRHSPRWLYRHERTCLESQRVLT